MATPRPPACLCLRFRFMHQQQRLPSTLTKLSLKTILHHPTHPPRNLDSTPTNQPLPSQLPPPMFYDRTHRPLTRLFDMLDIFTTHTSYAICFVIVSLVNVLVLLMHHLPPLLFGASSSTCLCSPLFCTPSSCTHNTTRYIASLHSIQSSLYLSQWISLVFSLRLMKSLTSVRFIQF